MVTGRGSKASMDCAVERPLLLLRREAVGGHEGNLGAVEPDALGAVLQGALGVRGQADVHPERDAMAVERVCAGSSFRSREALEERRLLAADDVVVLAQRARRIQATRRR